MTPTRVTAGAKEALGDGTVISVRLDTMDFPTVSAVNVTHVVSGPFQDGSWETARSQILDSVTVRIMSQELSVLNASQDTTTCRDKIPVVVMHAPAIVMA